jgi:hypothetical protein
MKKILFILTTLSCLLCTSTCFAQFEALSFRKLKRGRETTIRACDALDGVSTFRVSRSAISLGKNSKRGSFELPNNIQFVACGVDATGKEVLVVKRTKNTQPRVLNLELSDFPESKLGGVCKGVTPWPSSYLIYKTRGSDHFTIAGDRRKTTVGLIARAGAPVSGDFSCIEFLDAQGNVAFKAGRYATNSPKEAQWKFRAYSASGCGGAGITSSEITRQVTAKTGKNEIYAKIGSQCYGPINPGQCYGSSTC